MSLGDLLRSLASGHQLSQSHKWVLAAAGPLAHMNQEPFDRFLTRFDTRVCRSVLANDWDITDEESLDRTLRWLAKEGHHFHATQMARGKEASPALPCEYPVERAAFVESNRKAILHYGLRTWDYGRGLSVARWAVPACLMSKQDAWSWSCMAARNIQSMHESWDDYARAWQLGMGFWSDGAGMPSLHSSIEWLVHAPQSPWKCLSWGTDLSDLPGSVPP